MPETMVCRSAAKINLSLDVLALRADGYHELRSVVHTIDLWDELTLDFNARGRFSIDCNVTELERDDNLCLRATRAWHSACGEQAQFDGLHIDLCKTIPSGAGLGGGSGNAAAILVALNRRFDSPLTEEQLAAVAAKLGADVPLFLYGGCLLMEGIGERITPLNRLDGWVVLAKPATHLSTPEIFRSWDNSAEESRHGTEKLLSEIRHAGAGTVTPELANALHNDLQRIVGRHGIDVDGLVSAMRTHGALGAAMTGSGSAVFGLCADRRSAEETARTLRAQLDDSHWIEFARLGGDGVQCD